MFDLHFLHSSSYFFTTAKLKKRKGILKTTYEKQKWDWFLWNVLKNHAIISILLRTFNCDRKVITNFDLKNGIYYFLQRLFKLKRPIKLRIKQTFSSKLTPSCLTYYWHENYRLHCSSLTIAMQSRQSQDSDSNTLRARWAFPVVQSGKYIVFCKLKFLLDDLK